MVGVFRMLFLLNDVLFDLEETCPVGPWDQRRFEALDLDYVLELACELFAEDPMLHRNDPVRARRLAWLIHDRAEEVNAAMFSAPEQGCAPELVEPRFCVLPIPVMNQLKAREGHGKLDALAADVVWGRLAA